ncbi:PTS sugar transporter subunit IIA [Clostridium sp. MB05]|uniref:PTS sugar transporter subunit IIA n=1 Tax=Clostridium sp. MB05 TaxID=3376682 RepID=UPI0039824145
MIRELLTEDLVKVNIKASNWEDAVREAGELLYINNKVEKSYIDAMVKTVESMGPYIVMAPGIAMPHARPEAGVKDIGIAIISLEKPVNFGSEDFDPVKLVIALCASESKVHIELLKDLTNILDDEDLINKVDNCKTNIDLRNLIIETYMKNK